MAGLLTVVGTAAGAYFGGPWGAAAGAAIGSAIEGQQGAEQANAQNKRLYEDNRDWQERMSNTAVQRAARDMEAAGFNRLLATGASASTPSTSPPEMKNTAEPLQAGARDVLAAAQMAQAAKKQDSEIKLLESQKKATDAQAVKTAVDTEVARKGIPESEIKNEIYDWAKQKVKEANSYKAPSQHQQNVDLKSFKQRIIQQRGNP